MASNYFGLYSGCVTDNVDPDDKGQLHVLVPQILEPGETVVAKPLLPWGFFYLPEIDDKVWIQFEGGDLANPVWVGAQYVAGEWAEEAQREAHRRRVIRSAAGHVVIMNDAAGEESIEIFSDSRVVIRSSGSIEIKAPTVVINGRPVAPMPPSFTI